MWTRGRKGALVLTSAVVSLCPPLSGGLKKRVKGMKVPVYQVYVKTNEIMQQLVN